jgi:hypothetical protein
MNSWQRQKLESCAMLVQAAKKLLDVFTVHELPQIDEIRQCFDSAGKAIDGVLGTS